MKVLLVGQGPLPNTDEPFCAFPQLRTWSMYKALCSAGSLRNWEIRLQLLTLDSQHTLIINDTLLKSLEWADVIVTVGPYYPLFILPHVPSNTPVWVDFPSDPFADRDAKHQVDPISDAEWSVVTDLRQMALHRADGLGVISNRQKWVCYGALLEREATKVPVETIPIAFDFPTPLQPMQSGRDFLLAGSGNAWLDLTKIQTELQSHRLHCTGWEIPGYTSRSVNSSWLQYGWLEPFELQHVIEQCQFGVWADRDGVESTLGSRTRALFYIWSGLTPIGTLHTELATDLHQHGHLRTWEDHFRPIDIDAAQQFCQQHYGPQEIYSPLLNWLNTPTRIHRHNVHNLAQSNLKLRENISRIHNSPTWKIASKIHRLFKR